MHSSPADKAHVFVYSMNHHRSMIFWLFISSLGEKNPICKACHDEDSNVTDHFDNRRLLKRSVTSDFFSEPSLLFSRVGHAWRHYSPPRPGVITGLGSLFLRHLLPSSDTYLRSIRPVGRDSDYEAVTPAVVSVVARRRAQRAFTRLPQKTWMDSQVIVNNRGAEAHLTSADNRFCHLRWR